VNENLDLKRAKHALDAIKRLQEDNGFEKYTSYVKALPATILQNGLGQAMATLLAKGEEGDHRLLYDHVKEWLCSNDEASVYQGKSCLMTAITDEGEEKYLWAQAEALAYLTWLKKFALAFLVTEDKQVDSNDTATL